MVIDLRLMRGIRVDPEARTVRVQAGVLLGELDRETQAFGLVVPAGFVSHTGVAGLTLGDGIGFTTRKFGLTIDNLLSVDLIAAEGEVLKASEQENADLFWGVRGGGGNFGIVTEFDLVGQRVVAVVCVCAGSVDEGEEVVRPLKDFRPPALDLCAPMPFVAHQQMYDAAFPHGWWYYFRSCDVAELNDDIIDVMVDHGHHIESPITSLALWQMGGAVSRVGEGETAFNGRGAGHTFNINGNTMTVEGFAHEREWARGLWTALEPYHTGVYVNVLMDEGEDRVRQAYGAAKYDRLRALKRKYDPDNLFRLTRTSRPPRSSFRRRRPVPSRPPPASRPGPGT
jgi:hypothetical protein